MELIDGTYDDDVPLASFVYEVSADGLSAHRQLVSPPPNPPPTHPPIHPQSEPMAVISEPANRLLRIRCAILYV